MLPGGGVTCFLLTDKLLSGWEMVFSFGQHISVNKYNVKDGFCFGNVFCYHLLVFRLLPKL